MRPVIIDNFAGGGSVSTGTGAGKFIKKGNQEMIFKYKMGGKVQDVNTPFEGTIIARTEYFSGEKQYLVQPDGCTDNGQPIDAYWLTEKRLIIKERQP